jgi:rod shape-determining protein MreC
LALSRRSGGGRHSRSRFTLLLLVLTSITVLTLDFRGSGAVDGARGGASTVFSPIRDAGAWVGRPFANAWNGIFNYDDLAAENEQLRQEVEQLQGDAARGEDAVDRLRDIADAQGLDLTADLPTVLARVTGGPITNFEHTIDVDRGSDDGIAVGMPVVTGAGLVGVVEQVTPGRSTVRLVTDPGFAFGVSVAGDVGIASGRGDDEPMQIFSGLELQTEIEEDAIVTTSGSTIFPADIPVGRVRSVTPSPDGLTQEVVLDLLADLANLNYVSIIRWVPAPVAPPTAPAS